MLALDLFQFLLTLVPGRGLCMRVRAMTHPESP